MEEMKGVFIFKNDKNKPVYCDWLMKEARYITKSDYKIINMFQLSLPLCVLIIYVMHTLLEFDMIVSVLVAIGIFVMAKVIFDLTFIRNLPVAKNFKRPKSKTLFEYFEQLPTYRLVMMGILLIAFGVLTIYLVIEKGYEGIYLVMNIALVIAAFVFAGIALIVSLKRRGKKV